MFAASSAWTFERFNACVQLHHAPDELVAFGPHQSCIDNAHIGMLSADNHWETLAKAALRDDLASTLRSLTADALRTDASPRDPAALISAWKTRNSVVYERFRQVLTDLRTAESPDLAMLSVAMRELRNLSSR